MPVNIITFNKFSWESGYDYLLYALSILVNKRHMSNFKVTLVGEGQLFAAIKYTIEDLMLENHVDVVNKTSNEDEIKTLLYKNDIYVNFSVKYQLNLADEIAKLNSKYIVLSREIKTFKLENSNILYVPTRNTRLLANSLAHLILICSQHSKTLIT